MVIVDTVDGAFGHDVLFGVDGMGEVDWGVVGFEDDEEIDVAVGLLLGHWGIDLGSDADGGDEVGDLAGLFEELLVG